MCVYHAQPAGVGSFFPHGSWDLTQVRDLAESAFTCCDISLVTFLSLKDNAQGLGSRLSGNLRTPACSLIHKKGYLTTSFCTLWITILQWACQHLQPSI